MSRAFAALAAVFLAFIALRLAIPAEAAVNGLVRGTVTIDGRPAAGATVSKRRTQARSDLERDANVRSDQRCGR